MNESQVNIDVNLLIAAILSGNWVAIIVILIPAIHLIASLVTVATPSTAKNKGADFVLMLLNFLALNVLKNENADQVAAFKKKF